MMTFMIICITDYAMERAKKKGWITKDGLPQTRKEVRTAMSQKIGELKRKYEENKKKRPNQPKKNPIMTEKRLKEDKLQFQLQFLLTFFKNDFLSY